MVLDIVKSDDLKVYVANTLCFIVLKLEHMTPQLSALMLITTIVYTIVRTVNEIQKFRNGKANRGEEDN